MTTILLHYLWMKGDKAKQSVRCQCHMEHGVPDSPFFSLLDTLHTGVQVLNSELFKIAVEFSLKNCTESGIPPWF